MGFKTYGLGLVGLGLGLGLVLGLGRELANTVVFRALINTMVVLPVRRSRSSVLTVGSFFSCF